MLFLREISVDSLLQPGFRYWVSTMRVGNSVGPRGIKAHWVNSLWIFFKLQCTLLKADNKSNKILQTVILNQH